MPQFKQRAKGKGGDDEHKMFGKNQKVAILNLGVPAGKRIEKGPTAWLFLSTKRVEGARENDS